MSNETVSVAVDVMGGDFAPAAIIDGVGQVLDLCGNDYHLLLVGDQPKMEAELTRIGKLGDSRIELIHASEVIEMGEHPVKAVRHKRDSSINVAMNLVHDGRAQGVFSAGSTGGAVASAYFKLRMLEGIERPGIAAVMPSVTGHFVLMDAGASVDCAPENLQQYAVMGDIYARKVLGIDNPRVALMSNGTEEGKGCRLTQEAFPLLAKIPGINFQGNCEGHDLYSGGVDVVVCDGFVGNVILKCAESLGKSMTKMIKESMMSKLLWKIGGALSKGAFAPIKKKMDYAEIGGCPLLGVRGIVIIGHGISNGRAVYNGIRAVGNAVRERVNDAIIAKLKELEEAAPADKLF